jgi:hypothetical protein
MTVKIYSGPGGPEEELWSGEMEFLPRPGDTIALPIAVPLCKVGRVTFRLDMKPSVVEVYVR